MWTSWNLLSFYDDDDDDNDYNDDDDDDDDNYNDDDDCRKAIHMDKLKFIVFSLMGLNFNQYFLIIFDFREFLALRHQCSGLILTYDTTIISKKWGFYLSTRIRNLIYLLEY